MVFGSLLGDTSRVFEGPEVRVDWFEVLATPSTASQVSAEARLMEVDLVDSIVETARGEPGTSLMLGCDSSCQGEVVVSR